MRTSEGVDWVADEGTAVAGEGTAMADQGQGLPGLSYDGPGVGVGRSGSTGGGVS